MYSDILVNVVRFYLCFYNSIELQAYDDIAIFFPSIKLYHALAFNSPNLVCITHFSKISPDFVKYLPAYRLYPLVILLLTYILFMRITELHRKI